MKILRIEKEFEEFIILITRNGRQWEVILKGTEEECNIIKEAFIKIGYLEGVE